ncbi:MAG TPA: hypothetical protein VH854_07670 [Thermoanaerobaculia bacterium]|jgi:hypothetical protein|nr:hypothetical protein [Thermoanaerobaculia bacterium]
MKKWLAILGLVAIAAPASAQRVRDENGSVLHLYPDRAHAQEAHDAKQARPGGGGQNLVNHGGPVLASAKVVSIFWGPSWGNPSNQTLGTTASHITGFFGNFGSTGEWKTIDQYGAHPTSLSNAYWIDANNPPHTAVTDTDVQNEVLNYLNSHSLLPDDSTVYEVFIPNGYYSKSGNSNSCGGPNLQYCAYHGNFTGLGHDIKYSSMPYPSCGGCQATGFTVEQNLDHFSCHETREAASDPDLNAWYDRRGNEADDKCAWSPAPFIDAGFGYQWEWSNANGACVKTK